MAVVALVTVEVMTVEVMAVVGIATMSTVEMATVTMITMAMAIVGAKIVAVTVTVTVVAVPTAETLGDPYIRGLPLPRIPLSCELQPDAGQTVSVQQIAEPTPRARLTRLLNGHMKIMRGLE